MLTTDNFDASARRNAVRELADITSKSYNDDKIDAKISIGDIEARVWLQSTNTTDTTVVVSNYLTARNIRLGIGDNDNQNAARDLMNNAKKLIEAHNNKAPEQNEHVLLSSSGDNGYRNGTFG